MEITSHQPPILWLLGLQGLLFSTGLFLIISRRSMIFIIIGIELMMQAIIANYVALDGLQDQPGHGQIVGIFTLIVIACEGVVLLALSIGIYKKTHNSSINRK